jgi:hypothetical protein
MVKRRIDTTQRANVGCRPVRQAKRAFYRPATYDHYIDMLCKRANGMVKQTAALQ